MDDGAGRWPSATAGAGSDAPAGERRPARAECGPASARPRAGSPAGPILVQFLSSPLVGPTARTCEAAGAALRTETRWPTRTPRGLPRPAADRAGGRDRDSGAGAVPALWP